MTFSYCLHTIMLAFASNIWILVPTVVADGIGSRPTGVERGKLLDGASLDKPVCCLAVTESRTI